MSHVAGSLRALLANLIDYAGLYPPAALPLAEVTENYRRYRESPDSWMLNRLVLPFAKLDGLELNQHCRISLLVDDEPGPLPRQVETFEIKSARKLSLPTYCEVPLQQVIGGFAKVRTGGLTPDAIPSPEEIADFLCSAGRRRVPFKATAGLHHPLRSTQPLTYAGDSPRAIMHGFINVFVAAAFAWQSGDRALALDILIDCDPVGFEFGESELKWRDQRLPTIAITAARRDFAHSFGSCSFEEPLADLRKLGWLD